MKGAETDGAGDLVGWPEHHFAAHRQRFSEFDPASLRVILALRITAQRVENSLGSWFLPAGLTPQKFGVLVILQAEGRPVSLSNLRRYLGTTQANVTGLVAGLERDRFIERRGSQEDRRVSFISLARSGKRIVESVLPEYFLRNKNALRALNASEKKMLTELLGKVSRGYAALQP